jgi:hypothetical protein
MEGLWSEATGASRSLRRRAPQIGRSATQMEGLWSEATGASRSLRRRAPQIGRSATQMEGLWSEATGTRLKRSGGRVTQIRG